ncbi:MAG TPA: helix-turn-helix transcriptional regulator [Sphingomicrobium sp.]|jgi:DNA-binding transcriptional ArsR family regulator|nr:helix-turn-helix transcriptional regulator [Sphingomicrobium sp.]
MTNGPYIAEAASLIGDPARANMLAALVGGHAMTATELGLSAGVAASTASGHLAKLLEGRLVSVTSTGRHRYFRLASPGVARVLEDLMALATDGPPRHRPKSRCDDAMARARTCYDHLAGKLGVALADSMASRGLIILSDDGGLITDAGGDFLSDLGVELQTKKVRRTLCRPCLDWSERRWHVGGAVGAALADRCFALGWTERRSDSRAITITAAGERAFDELFEVRF